jgi:hypothetical protein
MTTRPVRLQLSRIKGFDLQASSLATNGLKAVNVARPSRWGNPFYVISEEGFPWVTDARDTSMPVLNMGDICWDRARLLVVKLFRERCVDTLPNVEKLRGKNLACWCKPGAHCHADVLLEIANK